MKLGKMLKGGPLAGKLAKKTIGGKILAKAVNADPVARKLAQKDPMARSMGLGAQKSRATGGPGSSADGDYDPSSYARNPVAGRNDPSSISPGSPPDSINPGPVGYENLVGARRALAYPEHPESGYQQQPSTPVQQPILNPGLSSKIKANV